MLWRVPICSNICLMAGPLLCSDNLSLHSHCSPCAVLVTVMVHTVWPKLVFVHSDRMMCCMPFWRGYTKTASLLIDYLSHHPLLTWPLSARYRIIQEVPPWFTNLTLDRLEPGIEYSVRINAISETGQTNQSRLIHFVSPDNGNVVDL